MTAGPRPAAAAATVRLLAAVAAVSASAGASATFSVEDIESGRAQYHRTCAQCHGRNMVNSGTTSYDLRRFPVDDPARFTASVTNGKGSMPSFKESLSPEDIGKLWAYVGSRGGKEP
jgi:cytochrome c6